MRLNVRTNCILILEMSQWTSSFSLIGPTGPAGSFAPGTTYGDYVYYDGTTWTTGSTIISIGSGAGQISQGAAAIALGQNAGNNTQSASAVAIGDSAGRTNQGLGALAFGGGAGYDNQGAQATAVGNGAGNQSQGGGALAFGGNAGFSNQRSNAIAIGNQAGEVNQNSNSIAIGFQAGQISSLGQHAIAIGSYAGQYSMNRAGTLAIGWGAAYSNQGQQGIAIGQESGNLNQGNAGTAIGYLAAAVDQGISAVAIGASTGYSNQGDYAIAIGYIAGTSNQASYSIAIGDECGVSTQKQYATAIGKQAGYADQGEFAIAIGNGAGNNSQGNYAIAIGFSAGFESQHSTSIVLNASDAALNALNSGLYINPIREVEPSNQFGLYYDTTSKEVIYNSIITISSLSTVVVSGNIVPDRTEAYTLGTSTLRYTALFVGPGSINIAGPSNTSATIGTDVQGIIYTESGFATPFVNIGPAQVTPLATGGWRIGPTGTQGSPDFGLIAQELQANGSGPTGPIYSLIDAPTGPTGPTGSIGPIGASAGLSLFLNLSTTATVTTTPVIDTLNLVPNLSTQTVLSYTFGNDTNAHLVGNFLTTTNELTYQNFSAGEWDLSMFASATDTNHLTFFGKVYSVDADGVSNKTLIVDGSSTAIIVTSVTEAPFSQPLFVSTGTITNISRRVLVELYARATTNQNGESISFYFRNNTNSHLFTTFLAGVIAGPTGPQGPTGPISMNYICQAKLTTDQTIISGGDVSIQFTDDYDPNGWWTTSNTFKPTIDGYYLVSASVWWAPGVSNTSNQTNIQIRQNSTIQKAIVQSPIEWNAGNTQSVTRIIQLNGSTDYLDITAYTGNTTSQVVQAGSGAGTWFSAALQ